MGSRDLLDFGRKVLPQFWSGRKVLPRSLSEGLVSTLAYRDDTGLCETH